jgi:hypothetical protein
MSAGCYAETVKGTIEKVNIKEYIIIVNGTKVNISKATVSTENNMNVIKNIIMRDVKDHNGQRAVCFGSFDKNDIFVAYKVRIQEDHK